MKNKILLNNGLRTIILTCLLLGVGFRFVNLGHKVYWYDEVQTSFRISGYTQGEFFQQVYIGWPRTVEDLLNTYQYPTPERNLKDSLAALSKHPEHSPLYFLTARFWMQTFPHSTATIRTLSALISLLIFPAIYWLCWELFQWASLCWLAVGIVAISPFQVLYAQEARAYSLWAVTILLSGAALLGALRTSKAEKSLGRTILNWGIYSLTVALGLYSHLFSIFVLTAQAAYIFLSRNWRKRKFIVPYLASSLMGVLLFSPWLFVFVQNLEYFLENTESRLVPREGLTLFWLLNLNRIFFDFNQGISPLNITLYLTLALTVYALCFLIKTTPQRVWLFVLTLIGVPGMILILPDIILGGRGSTIARYAMPCYLGIQISVAYLLTKKITNPKISNAKKKRWQWILYALIFAGILSCTASLFNPVWWHKSYAKSRDIPISAKIINRSDSPLVISDEEPGRIMSLLHELDPNVKMILIPEYQIPILPDTQPFTDVLLYRPTGQLIEQLEEIYSVKVEKPYETSWVRKVEFLPKTENSTPGVRRETKPDK